MSRDDAIMIYFRLLIMLIIGFNQACREVYNIVSQSVWLSAVDHESARVQHREIVIANIVGFIESRVSRGDSQRFKEYRRTERVT
jgi:hypothetical protein